jgi:hypothetical protein
VRACAEAAGVCAQAHAKCSGKNPKGLAADANTTSRWWLVVTAHGKVVAGSWRGNGSEARVAKSRHGRVGLCGGVRARGTVKVRPAVARRCMGRARPRGAGAHARARGLASQGHGVAVSCAGHRHPGPAARRGGGGATAAATR